MKIAAGTYDTEIIIDLINQVIQDNEDLETYKRKTKLVLSNGKNFFQEVPKVIDRCTRKDCFSASRRN